MGYIVGSGAFPSTWRSMRTIVTATVPPPPFPNPSPVIADHNEEWPASAAYLKTIEGNGLIRIATPAASTPGFFFTPNNPPFDDYFVAGPFVEPYPDQLFGRTVTTVGSSFSIVLSAFDVGQNAGMNGDNPISVEWFQALT